MDEESWSHGSDIGQLAAILNVKMAGNNWGKTLKAITLILNKLKTLF